MIKLIDFLMEFSRPKKRYGQHFLTDENMAKKIVAALPENQYPLLEIGPGHGVLTKYLFTPGISGFYAVEIDEDIIRYLENNLPGISRHLIHADFLKLDFQALFPADLVIIGNFPYNISSQILFRVLEHRNRVIGLVGMFQKEVAIRISAPPGNRDYGILSVLVQAFFDVEYLFTVPASVFSPPPKVQSAVIRLSRKPDIRLGCDEKIFFRLVKSAFNQRRKTLRNALRSFDFDMSFTLSGLMGKRAEQLAVSDFINLVNGLKNEDQETDS